MVLKVVNICLIVFWVLIPSQGFAENVLGESLHNFVTSYLAAFKDKPTIAIDVLDAETGTEIFKLNANELVKPASVLKIITAYGALVVLGPEYQFPTEIFCDKFVRETYTETAQREQLQGAVGNLYVRGYGDPSLVSEKLFDWTQTLKQLGVKKVQNIIVDDSLLVDTPLASGTDPYQAAQSALSLNHNSYAVRIAPAGLASPAVVTLTPGAPYELSSTVFTKTVNAPRIDVLQTPQSAGFKRKLSNINDGSDLSVLDKIEVRVRGEIPPENAPVVLYQSVPDPATYFASVMKYYLIENDITVSGGIFRGEIPSKAKPLIEFKGEPLSRIVVDMNRYSNNFIAGQILYALGQDSVGYFRIETGRKRLGEVLSKLGVKQEDYSITDGSGLSDRNRITARTLSTVLLSGYRDLGIYPLLISSFSRFEKSGTLKRRSLKLKARSQENKKLLPMETLKGSIWAKTGTIEGVSSLAGYMTNSVGKKIIFVIISNGVFQKQMAIALEDGILERILEAEK